MTAHLIQTLKQLKTKGRFRSLTPPAGIDLSSNDYLGLRDHPAIKNAALCAVQRGVSLGAGGSRLLLGNQPQHWELEEFAADYFAAERCLFMANGYISNAALFGSLPSRHDVVLFDSLIHASAREAIQHSHARHVRIAHNDLNAFEETLKANAGLKKKGGHIWIAVESVYSMDGDIAPLTELLILAREHGATLIVDEAHGTGTMGATGKGVSEDVIAAHGHDNLIVLHTCGKALGLSGGLICGDGAVVDTLINTARPFIYSTAPAPLMAILVQEALILSASEEGKARRKRLRVLNMIAQQNFKGEGRHIVPIIIGDDEAAMACAVAMQDQGYDIRAIRPPTVPEGTARLRLSLNANLTPQILNDFANVYNIYQSKQEAA
jgi:8-amino-7-oxononanoate synthase